MSEQMATPSKRRKLPPSNGSIPKIPKRKTKGAIPASDPVPKAVEEDNNEEVLEAIATFHQTYKVHPIAEAYPIMIRYKDGKLVPDDLLEIAASIEANGQRLPAIRDQYDRIIDGRNRIICCIYLGLEPWIVQQKFADERAIIDYVYDTNGPRRHLNAGQKTIGYAILYPMPHSGPKNKSLKSSKFEHFHVGVLSHARAIVSDAPELATKVRDGDMPFEEARRMVYAARTEALEIETRMAKLRRWAPDLAELVDQEKLKINDAYTVYEKRTAQQRGILNGGLSAGKAGLRELVANVNSILSAAQLVEQGLADQSDIANMVDIKAFEEAEAAMTKLREYIMDKDATNEDTEEEDNTAS